MRDEELDMDGIERSIAQADGEIDAQYHRHLVAMSPLAEVARAEDRITSIASLRESIARTLQKPADGTTVVVSSEWLNVTSRRMERAIPLLRELATKVAGTGRFDYADKARVAADGFLICQLLLQGETPHACADCGHAFELTTDATLRYVGDDPELVHTSGRGCAVDEACVA